MMKIHPVFTNFLAIENLDIDNQSVIDYCMQHRSVDIGRVISNDGGYQSNNVEMRTTFPQLYHEVSKRLDELHHYFEFKESMRTRVTDSWININGKNDYNTVHDHGGGLFSGIYYASAGKDKGVLEFMTPIGAHTFSINGSLVKTSNPFNSNIQSVHIETGMLVIFPSWLMHYTRPNRTDEPRISVAFNSYIS